MKFDFIPYNLNTNFEELKDNLLCKDSDEIDCYLVRELPVKVICEIPINKITLYFFKGKLITSYIQLNERNSNQEKVIRLLERYLKRKTMVWEEDNGFLYNWETKTEFLGLLSGNDKGGFLYLYHTIKEYNIFNE